MEKITITETYAVKFWFSETHCVTICGKIINAKHGRIVRQFLRGKKKAVYIDGKYLFVDDLKPIKREAECPF